MTERPTQTLLLELAAAKEAAGATPKNNPSLAGLRFYITQIETELRGRGVQVNR